MRRCTVEQNFDLKLRIEGTSIFTSGKKRELNLLKNRKFPLEKSSTESLFYRFVRTDYVKEKTPPTKGYLEKLGGS